MNLLPRVVSIIHPNEENLVGIFGERCLTLHQGRYDRVLVNSSKWIVQSAKLLGGLPLAQVDGKNVFPSDHLGILVSLCWKQDEKEIENL
jgi:hypothetical protein